MNLFCYLRTLRHLRASQVIGQVRVRVAKRLRDPARCRGASWSLSGTDEGWIFPDPVPSQNPLDLARGRFCFLGKAVDLGEGPDWTARDLPRLWQYNLQYFDWLWSLLPAEGSDWNAARRLTLDWIERHPPKKTACGWEPYPTSLRLINWCLLYGCRHRRRLAADDAFREALLRSVSMQAAWLEKNLETHIQANHLLENLAALTCVAAVFEGPERQALQARMRPMLGRELEEQVLPDGMHYERSPMYHLRVLWLLEVLEKLGETVATAPKRRMGAALGRLRHPDGGIALFNDAALGIYLDSWPAEPEEGCWALQDAGYYGFRNSDGDYLIADAGAVGPDHQPGHAHADFLSFELSLAGRRVVTDTGVGTYETGKQRVFDRSTAAHSTVEVEGQNSVEVWGGFRVGRRSTPRILRWEPRGDGMLLEAEHRGYRYLPGRVVHRRCFEWRSGSLEIRDRVMTSKPLEVAGRIHLAPGVDARIENRVVKCRLGDLDFNIEIDGEGPLALERMIAFPEFGQGRERTVVVMRARALPPELRWRWWIDRA